MGKPYKTTPPFRTREKILATGIDTQKYWCMVEPSGGNWFCLKTGEIKMREIIVSLPDVIMISGAKDAPEQYRAITTEKWENDFIIAALTHSMSQKIGDPWGNKKNLKRMETVAAVHAALCEGRWSVRNGESGAAKEAKFNAAIAALNAEALLSKLTKEQLAALAALVKPD